MTAQPVRIICRDCQRHGDHNGRGLCEPCYRKHDKDRTLHQWPGVRGDHQWRATHVLTQPAAPRLPKTTSSDDSTWATRAACRGHDPELWFPVSENGPHIERAKAICRGCPVQTECLERALHAGEPFGIWGGLTTLERRRVRASRLERTSA